MKRVAALDLLRGTAAFSVAIPHYLTLNTTGWIKADLVAVIAVEVFFVLSGFVLAPQILTQVVGQPARNLRTFLLRRWLRTIPPYLVALLCISYVTGQLWTADFVRTTFYVQNLFFQANLHDYYPVAWSLSVEEWFYVTFAPLAFVTALLHKGKGWGTSVYLAVALVLAIGVARVASSGAANWDADIRRVTVFRIDSIVFGFLFFVAIAHWPRHHGPSLAWSVAIFVACSALTGLVTYHSAKGSALGQFVFFYAAAAMGLSAVWLARRAEPLLSGRRLPALSTFLGNISYSVYLFHLVLAMILKPTLQKVDQPWPLIIYVAILVAWCSLFWRFFERPILASRPNYRVESGADQHLALVPTA